MSTVKWVKRGRNQFALGDCLEVLPTIESESIDAIVTDPPAGIGFMGKEWDQNRGGRDRWIDWLCGVMTECHRVLKPGGHALVWAIPRTSHWTATAVEDAGFEIRDVVMHVFGSGFPKSLDVSKAIDKEAGVEREVVGSKIGKGGENLNKLSRPGGADAEDSKGCGAYGQGAKQVNVEIPVTAPATDAAREWEGWGTALKPAAEHWILARKPLIGTVAQNVQQHGTGAINVDACRVPADWANDPSMRGVGYGFVGSREDRQKHQDNVNTYAGGWSPESTWEPGNGRWPANLILSWPEDEYELRRDISAEQKAELYRWMNENT